MTQDKDREAFESAISAAMNPNKHAGFLNRKENGSYCLNAIESAWVGWTMRGEQERLTEAEAVEIVAELQANGWVYGTHPRDKASIVIAALKEAGMKFKGE